MKKALKMTEITLYTTQGYVSTAGVKVLVYSPPHKGKTDMIRTLPDPVVIAAEKGLVTLSRYNIPYMLCRNVEELKAIITWIKEKKYAGKFKSIALDSVSYLGTLLLSEFRNNPKVYTNDGRKHYGDMKQYTTDLLDALFAADINVYVTAWEADKYDAFGSLVGVEPHTEGKALGSFLIHYFDLTCHLAWHTIEMPQQDGTTLPTQLPYLQTVEANGKFARSRKQGLEPYEPADMTQLFNKLATLP